MESCKFGNKGGIKLAENKEQTQVRDTKKVRVLGKASEVKGKLLKEWTLPPGEGLGFTVKRGQLIRIIDIEGQQTVDFACFNSKDKNEKLWIGTTIINNRNVFIKKGHSLYSQYVNKMFTIIEDTCGVHDLLLGACSPEVYEKNYGVKGHNSCIDNMVKALAAYGLKRKDIPMNLNLFMNCPIKEDGSYNIDFSKSRRGDFVDLKAEMDCIVAISNCPCDLSPESGYHLTPIKVIIYEPKIPMNGK